MASQLTIEFIQIPLLVATACLLILMLVVRESTKYVHLLQVRLFGFDIYLRYEEIPSISQIFCVHTKEVKNDKAMWLGLSVVGVVVKLTQVLDF